MVHLTSSSDVDYFLDQLKKLRDESDNERMLNSFVKNHLPQFMDILHDYKALKDLEHIRRLDEMKDDTRRTIVEGFSADNIEEAFRNALDKVARYFSAQHEVSITILGLVHLPKGGHRAVLEVHISQSSMRDEDDVDSPDVENRKGSEKNYEETQLKRRKRAERLIFDHFLQIANAQVYVPDYFRVRVTDAEILNLMIEKEFFGAAHKLPQEAWMFRKSFDDPNLPIPDMIVRLEKKLGHRPDQPEPE